MMLADISLDRFKSILCLNGALPSYQFFKELNVPIIAADGAANTLNALGINPDLIIGDLDSVNPRVRANSNVLYKPNQDTSDYQKCLLYLKEQQLLPAIVVGVTGGCLDHILNNINIFLTTDCILYAPPIIGFVLKAPMNQSHSLPKNTKISLIGMPNATVTSQGLEWELDRAELCFPGSNSCFNRTTKPTVKLTVHQGSALVLIYTEPSIDAGIC